jgi:intracellular sulfur oxidation DsrE/DsrF family protein
MKTIAFAALLLVPLAAGLVQADERYEKQKVVYHVNFDDAATQKAALGNIQNHISAVGAENVEVKVVMHGDGISLLLEPDAVEGTKMKAGNATGDQQAKISGLKDQGVAFEICANTLKGREVPLDALYDAEESDIVPSGVAELSRLQQMGYTYIKP